MINECLMDLRKKNSLTLVSEDEAEEVGFNDPGLEKIDAVYTVVSRSKFIRLTPEIYVTDNFREVLPGFSIKFF